ncbi:MAG: hypothetical protein ABGZ53_14175 [Fuerstiella sp.]
MAATDKYFQFPLSLLIGKWDTSAELAHAIIDYGLMHLLKHPPRELDEDARFRMAERYADRNELVEGADYETDCDHELFMAVAEFLNVQLGVKDVQVAMERVNRSAARYSDSGTQCRVRTDIAWDMMDWPVNKTRVLIGVYAGIGQDKLKWISGPRLQLLSAGYSGKADAANHQFKGELTAATVRYWVDELWRANFFQMATESRKKTYYSNKFTTDRALAAYVKEVRPAEKRKVTF